MQYDESRIVQTVLTVLQLSSYKDGPQIRAWKGIDFNATDRPHELGYIEAARGTTKSVVFTGAGAEAARAAAARRVFRCWIPQDAPRWRSRFLLVSRAVVDWNHERKHHRSRGLGAPNLGARKAH